MPISFAAGACVKKAKGAACPSCSLSPPVEARDSRFGNVDGVRRARNRAICVSLRVFSARRAAFSFWVSMSLRRRV